MARNPTLDSVTEPTRQVELLMSVATMSEDDLIKVFEGRGASEW